MKKLDLTLEQTWAECLKMWKWIVENYKKLELTIWNAKRKWLNENGYRNVKVKGACFFCHYVARGEDVKKGCFICPGALVDATFHCATFHSDYHWSNTPENFYHKLLELDKIRREGELKNE